MDSIPHFFPPVCVWPRSHNLEHQQAPNLWKFFCCWWLLGGKKRTCNIEPSNPGNWVTTSRKEGARGCRKHLGVILAYLFSKQQRANLSSGTRGLEWTGRCQKCIGASEKIHSFTHSFMSKSSSLGTWSPYKQATICLNDLRAKWGQNQFYLCQNSSRHGLPQSPTFTRALHENFWTWPSPPVFKSDWIPLVQGNMFQCLLSYQIEVFPKVWYRMIL